MEEESKLIAPAVVTKVTYIFEFERGKPPHLAPRSSALILSTPAPISRFFRSHLISMITSRTEFGQQMRSGDLLAYLSLNRLLNGVLSCSQCYFVRFRPISQKFNSCVTDGPTDRLIEMRECI